MKKSKNTTYGNSNEDWVVTMEDFEIEFDSWTKKNVKIPEISNLAADMLDTHMEIYIGEEDDVDIRNQIMNDKYLNIYNKLNLPYFHELNQPDRYVRVYENALSDNFCDHIINVFEQNPQYHTPFQCTTTEVLMMKSRPDDSNISKKIALPKTTDELNLTKFRIELEKENNYISQQLTKHLLLYFQDLNLPSPDKEYLFGFHDAGYQMQKYTKNKGRYIFHDDTHVLHNGIENKLGYRTATFLFYVNDVEEGGETTFPAFQVKPKKGSLLFFPATWNYVHSANIPRSSNKYIITGWMYRFTDSLM